jgi:hypothetical protein
LNFTDNKLFCPSPSTSKGEVCNIVYMYIPKRVNSY